LKTNFSVFFFDPLKW